MRLGAEVMHPMSAIDRQAVGRRITARREALGMTQAALAARINELAGPARGTTTPTTVSRWENGHAYPRNLLAELCTALEMGTDELLSGAVAIPTAERDAVKLNQLRKLLRDEDLAHLPPEKLPALARLLEGVEVEAWRAKAALEMLFPRPPKGGTG